MVHRKIFKSAPWITESWHQLSNRSLILRRRFHLNAWFPHFPLALAVGLTGGLVLFNVYGSAFHLAVNIASLEEISKSLAFTALSKFSETAAGIILVLMSLGLLRRSRLAWFVTLLLTGATLGIVLFRQYSEYLIWYSGALFVSLLLSGRHFNKTSLAAGSLFALSSILLFLAYGVFGSYILGKDFSPHIENLSSALYFTVVTISTVGYGEITPSTEMARLFVVSLIVFGITAFTTSATTVLAPIVTSRIRKFIETRGENMERNNHVIIAGNTTLSKNTYLELQRRNIPVTFIASRDSDLEKWADADIIEGDASSVEVLRKAGVEKAQAVLALGDDDSENAFVVLAVKEVDVKVKTICAVNDAKNISRVRRVQPDMLIAPQVLGGELLALALSGETPDPEELMGRLFSFMEKN
jgi:voltage-gated potassium channel